MALAIALLFASVATSLGDTSLPTKSNWGQRWAFGQFAPKAVHASDQGLNERLGCQSTALAQITFFHRMCPTGVVNYTAPNHPTTAMDFDAEHGLCDWSSFSLSPPNVSTDPGMLAVAKYEYAAALVVQKEWGTGSYMLTHEERATAVAQHFNVDVTRWELGKDATREDLVNAIVADIDKGIPLKMHIAEIDGGYHWIVIDGYKASSYRGSFEVHLNIGHSGFDNGWYDFDTPICLRHYQNGTKPEDGGCAFNYNRLNYREVWSIRPRQSSVTIV